MPLLRVVATLALLAFPSFASSSEPPDPLDVARRVDSIMAASWAKKVVVPASPADDAEFLRRASLDLVGRVPRADDVRAFLADTTADKRTKLVEQFLKDDRHHAHLARVWRDVFMPRMPAAPGQPNDAFENWLRDRVADNTSYDQLARKLITADARPDITPQPESLYLRALGADPGNIASSSGRVFLGLSLECARCHNHPFARWSRTQFWQLAAVFEDAEPVAFRVAWAPRIRIPDTDRVVMATLPDGTPVKESPGSGRDQFAAWLARPDNPYFARAAVNRVWAQFLGSELAPPPEPGEPPAPHDAALDELSRAFVQSGFDLRFLVRAVTATRAYQLTSARTHPSQDDPAVFARMAIKPLSADQLADTLAVVLGEDGPAVRAAVRDRFAGTDGETTILQALWWMNGPVAVRSAVSRVLSGIADNDRLDARGKVEELFLVALGRLPSKAEAERFAKHVESGGDKALADVFWVLLNSTEFAVNR